jgi:hypothetical protein
VVKNTIDADLREVIAVAAVENALAAGLRTQVVVVLTVPTNYLLQNRITLGANNEAARTILANALAGLHCRDPLTIPAQKTSWQLLYAPDGEMYFLNAHGVPSPRIPGTSRVYSPKQ